MKVMFIVLVVAVSLNACEKSLCGCTPLLGGQAVISGTVVSQNSTPVSGATAKLQFRADQTCAEVTTGIANQVQTGSNGRFRFETAWSGGADKCFAVWAEGASVGQVTQKEFVHINFVSGAQPDSVELLLRLP